MAEEETTTAITPKEGEEGGFEFEGLDDDFDALDHSNDEDFAASVSPREVNEEHQSLRRQLLQMQAVHDKELSDHIRKK